mmetsp:Transcript_3914/g.13589  ORF Transcript_3914/g.13589 Transcript_3914/m.13589 type:complete len:269 (+) Transcript_3914:5500-6306(+)
MACGVPTYRGSSGFSSVVRYFTLSLLSFAASVTAMSMSFHLRCAFDRAATATPSTVLHSLLLSCSVMELNLAIRERQYSSSVSGPASALSLRSDSFSDSSASVFSHQSSRTSSKCPAIVTSVAATAKSAGLMSTFGTIVLSGFLSSTPPLSDVAASASAAPNLAAPWTNSCAPSSVFFPHTLRCCLARTGTKRLLTSARNDASAPPRTSPAMTSCSTVFSVTPLGLTRMKYSACSRRESTSPEVRKSFFGAPGTGANSPSGPDDVSGV